MGANVRDSSRPLRDACKADTLMRPFLQIASGHRRGAESSKLTQFTVLLMRFLALESTGQRFTRCCQIEESGDTREGDTGSGNRDNLTYFLMLSGEGRFVKSDTHIRRFVSDGLGVPWSNLVSADRAAGLLREAARRFAVNLPGLTRAKLDHAVWADQKLRTRPYRDGAGGGGQEREGYRGEECERLGVSEAEKRGYQSGLNRNRQADRATGPCVPN